MPSEARLLKVPLHNTNPAQGHFALIHIRSGGPHKLDVQLDATENSAVFSTKISSKRVQELRATSNGDDDAELWVAVLTWILLRQHPAKKYASVIKNLEVHGAIGISGMTITIRQDISGITQQLGALHLERTDDEDLIDLFEWAAEELEGRDAATSQLAKIQETCDTQRATIDKLKAQLDEFVKAKRKDEDRMLDRFRQLLNTKKLKIRDQQRLLAGARINRSAAEDVQRARRRTLPIAKPSTAQKRKGNQGDGEGLSDDDEEASNEENRHHTVTPDRSDDSEEDEVAFQAAPASGDGSATQRRGGLSPPATYEPNRELPKREKEAQDDDEDDEETDDEL